jgi:prepilin-type N-terminal cleavage/methylation domain-containing protein
MFRRKNSAGFSLIEVLIATVVLCTIIPLTSYFVSSMKTNKKTELYQKANYVAQKYMEEYKAKDVKDIVVGDITDESVEGLKVFINVKEEIVEGGEAKRLEIEKISAFLLKLRDLSAGGEQEISFNDPLEMTVKLDYGVRKIFITDRSFALSGEKVILSFKNFGGSSIAVDVANELEADPSSGLQPMVTIYNPNAFSINNLGGRFMIINSSPDNRRVTITVTVKNVKGEELVKIAQNRMIPY